MHKDRSNSEPKSRPKATENIKNGLNVLDIVWKHYLLTDKFARKALQHKNEDLLSTLHDMAKLAVAEYYNPELTKEEIDKQTALDSEAIVIKAQKFPSTRRNPLTIEDRANLLCSMVNGTEQMPDGAHDEVFNAGLKILS